MAYNCHPLLLLRLILTLERLHYFVHFSLRSWKITNCLQDFLWLFPIFLHKLTKYGAVWIGHELVTTRYPSWRSYSQYCAVSMICSVQQYNRARQINKFIFLPAATKLGQGNIFTSVCQEFCPQGGGCLPQCMLGYTPPQTRQTPREQTPPSQTRQTIPLPPTRQTPRTRQTPPDQADTPPPEKQTPAYGLRAAGTHPTGMHSCQYYVLCETGNKEVWIINDR